MAKIKFGYRFVKSKRNSSYQWKGSFLVQQFLGFLDLPQDIFSSCLGCKGKHNLKNTQVIAFECCYLILMSHESQGTPLAKLSIISV